MVERIEGRADAPGCTLAQFPFSSLPSRSISFRIPIPTFGLGFVEATPDAALLANLASTSSDATIAADAAALGITGTLGSSGQIRDVARIGLEQILAG